MGTFIGLLEFVGLLGFWGGIIFLILMIIIAIKKKTITKMFIGFSVSIILFVLGFSLPSNLNIKKATVESTVETSTESIQEDTMSDNKK